jgi:hypothetical protein
MRLQWRLVSRMRLWRRRAVEVPQCKSLDGFGQLLADALHQSKRRKLQAPSQSTDECNVNNKVEDNTDMQNPETPPKVPRPPTTPPPKLARQLDNMSNEVKSLFVIARNLQRDRDCHKTSFLMCFTRLTNLQNNVKEMQSVVSWKISDLITRVFADERTVMSCWIHHKRRLQSSSVRSHRSRN